MGLGTVAAIASAIKEEEERHRKKMEELKKKKEATKRTGLSFGRRETRITPKRPSIRW